MTSKRRALVLSDETARHPFLRSLPQHVRHGIADLPDDEERPGVLSRMKLSSGDCRDFLATYCASFVAVSIFIG